MFSLIMSSNEFEWVAGPEDDLRRTYMVSRFLEYTESSIEAKFKPLTNEKLKDLESMPALFMSEIQFGGEDYSEEYVRVLIGNVKDVKISESRMEYVFAISEEIGKVAISNREEFSRRLSIAKWELYRTHWAIKDESFEAIVDFLKENVLEDERPVAETAQPSVAAIVEVAEAEDASEAFVTSSYSVVVESLQQFIAEILKFELPADEEIFYRGHADSSYQLVPTLFRKHDSGAYRWLQKENVLVREILTAQAREFANDKTTLDQLVRMQHYGLPTRLLDVTSNPLVALYFCCSEQKTDANGDAIDGEVIVLKTKISEVKYFDSDKVSCIANLCLLTEDQLDKIEVGSDCAAFAASVEGQRLLNFIRREKPHFEAKIVPSDLAKILFVRGRIMHDRISSQAGAFLIFGKDAVLPETGHSQLDIKRITVRNKEKILKELEIINIKASTVYPGFEKTAADIARVNEMPK